MRGDVAEGRQLGGRGWVILTLPEVQTRPLSAWAQMVETLRKVAFLLEAAVPLLREFSHARLVMVGKETIHTGLGLSFVQEVAALHGGSFDIANVPDGVRAVLTLPED